MSRVVIYVSTHFRGAHSSGGIGSQVSFCVAPNAAGLVTAQQGSYNLFFPKQTELEFSVL
jgi:hypothetical protein